MQAVAVHSMMDEYKTIKRKVWNPAKLKQLKTAIREMALPELQRNDKGHRVPHVEEVFSCMMEINHTNGFGLDELSMCACAWLHDVQCHVNRDEHHTLARAWVEARRKQYPLNEIADEEMERILNAIENHRSSTKVDLDNEDLLCLVMRSGDRGRLNVLDATSRAYMYSMGKLAMSDKEAGLQRAYDHLQEKYGSMVMEPVWLATYDKCPQELYGNLSEEKPYSVADVELYIRANGFPDWK